MKTIKDVPAWLLVLSQSLYAVPMQAVERQPSPAPAAEPRAAASVSTPGVDQQPPAASAGTPAPVRANRRVPAVKPVPRTPVFSVWPTSDELFRARVFEEPLVPVNGQPTPEDTRALASALRSYQQAGSGESVDALVGYLEGHSLSPWRPSLQLNMGLAYLRTGYYSRALRALEESWSVAQGAKDLRGKAVADRALGELVRLSARFGQLQRLEEFLHIAEGRDVGGSAAEMIEQGKQGLWLIRHVPQRTLRCGPIGLDRILALAKPGQPPNPSVEAFSASAHGTTLLQMHDLAKAAGLAFQMAKRVDQSAEIPTPALIHWSVGHFAAALRSEPRGLLIEDPTFGPARWVSHRVVHSEASGYALVREGGLPRGWRSVDQGEAGTVWGMGPTPGDDPQRQRPCDGQSGGSSGGGGGCSGGQCPTRMAQYSFHTMLVSLHVFDTPVGYAPPRGPSVQFSVSYHQREVFQPQIFTYFNLGPKWTSNWVSYVEDDPTATGQPANVYLRGGGQETLTGFDTVTGAYAYSVSTRARLVKVSDDPVVYERRLPDGSVDVYAQPDGTLAFPRKVFLTRSVDPQGNALSLTYDSSLRLVAITDAMGQVSTLTYGLASDPLKITRVTDPFGRYASFDYDTAGRLARITDVIGIHSSFEYGAADFIKSLTTPYGTTTFRTAEAGRLRWLEASDPLGGTERLESVNDIREALTGVDFTFFPAQLANSEYPTGFHFMDPVFSSSYFWYRNTFFWSKRAHALAPGDYTAAKLTHWAHTASGAQTSGAIENEREPLESMRTFYKYPGQASMIREGTHPSPSGVGRVVEDGSSQIWQYEYNARGLKTKEVDPLGRETVFVYGTNNVPDASPTTGEGMDLLQVKQKNLASPGGYDLLQTFSYNSQHLPLTVTDAAGQTTTFTYLSDGRRHTVVSPPRGGLAAAERTTTYSYYADNAPSGAGRLQAATGPSTAQGSPTTSYTYDGYGRVQAVTDSDGYTVAYDYDSLDRRTRIAFPDGTYEEIVYNRLDAEKHRDRAGRWSYAFHDALRREVSSRDSLGRTITKQWCSCGSLDKVIDSDGDTTTWERDLQGRITREVRSDGSATAFTFYNTIGLLKQKQDAKNQVASYEYFLDNSLKQITYTNAPIPTPAVSFTYDTAYSRRATMTDGTGTTTYSYHPVGASPTLGARLLQAVDGPLSADTVSYSYDELNRRTARSVNDTTETRTYDALGRVTTETNALGTFANGYVGATHRRQSVTYPNGQTTTYSYSGTTGDMRQREITNERTGGDLLSRFQYTYSPVGNITTWTQQVDSNPARVYDFSYDAADQLTAAAYRTTGPSPATLKRYAYTYDFAGNRTSEQVDDSVTLQTYDGMNRITLRQPGGTLHFAGTLNESATVSIQGKPAEVDATNAFRGQAQTSGGTNTVVLMASDPSGNVRTNTYEVSISGTTRTFAYDSNGNLTSDGARTFEWDAEDRLVAVIQGARRTELTYDGLGRKTRIVEKDNGTTTTERRFVWSEMEMVEERDAAGGTVVRRFFSRGIQEGTAVFFQTKDHLGSIREVTDSAGGLVARYDYDPYGRFSQTFGTRKPLFGYADQYADPGSAGAPQAGLYYYRSRHYDPETGRFLSEDPIRSGTSPTYYAYVGNNPVVRIDPYGLASTRCKNCGDKGPDVQNAFNQFCRLMLVNGQCAMALVKLGLTRCAAQLCTDGLDVNCNLPEQSACGATFGGEQVILFGAAFGRDCPAPRPGATLAHEIAHKCGVGCDVYHPFYCPYEKSLPNRDAADSVGEACSQP